jgi:hypothetical protein
MLAFGWLSVGACAVAWMASLMQGADLGELLFVTFLELIWNFSSTLLITARNREI